MHLIRQSQRSCHGVCLVSHHRGDCCHLVEKNPPKKPAAEAPDAFAARSADETNNNNTVWQVVPLRLHDAYVLLQEAGWRRGRGVVVGGGC